MATDQQGRTIRRHSGEGQFISSFVLCMIPVAAILVSFWLFTMPENLAFVLGIVIYGAALLIPTWIISSKTASASAGGHQLTLDIPESTESISR